MSLLLTIFSSNKLYCSLCSTMHSRALVFHVVEWELELTWLLCPMSWLLLWSFNHYSSELCASRISKLTTTINNCTSPIISWSFTAENKAQFSHKCFSQENSLKQVVTLNCIIIFVSIGSTSSRHFAIAVYVEGCCSACMCVWMF